MEILLKNLKTAIFKVMETMFFLIPDGENAEGCSVYIGITGEPNYLITFDFNRTLSKKMAESILGTEDEEIDIKMIQKCLKETANIIAGNFLLSFDSSENRNLTLPQTVKDEVFGKHRKLDEKDFSISFEGEDIKVIIERIEII
jgi:CheY-specific phosphatase CheX